MARVIHASPFPHSPPHHQPPRQNPNPKLSLTPRRTVLLLLSIPSLVASVAQPPSSAAVSFGISGPKEWLRDQKKKAAKFVLAPIDASRQSLRSAYSLLTSESKKGDPERIRGLLNSATRDCVLQSRSSIVNFQASTGVEVCTFRLIVRNAASLLDKGDPIKLEAETRLGDLIRSFSLLDTTVDKSDFQLASDREKVKDGLMDSISALDKFEQGIKDCLDV